MSSTIAPWSPYEGRPLRLSAGRISLIEAFSDLVKIRAGFSPFDLPEIFSLPSDDGDNDACRDLVRLDAELLVRKLVVGEIETYARKLNGGEVEPLAADRWEIDDPLPRLATGALNVERWTDAEAPPTHRIFVNADQFDRWLVALKPPGPLTHREIEAIVDPQVRAKRRMAHIEAPVITSEASTSSAITPVGSDGLGPELLKLSDVEALTTRKKSTIYKLESENKFPKRIKLGESSRWKRSEVEEWLRGAIAEGSP